MKKVYLLPAVSLLGGCAGFALRRVQLRTAFEPGSGLPISGAPATLSLLALALLVAAALAALAWRKGSLPMPYEHAFSGGGVSYLLLAAAGAALTALGAGLTALDWRQGGGLLPLAFVCATLLAAACMALIAGRNHRARWRGQGSVILLAPPFAACLWLMLSYQGWAKDPVISDYVFALFAIMSAMLTYYYMAAYSFGQPRETLTLLFGHLCVFFCIISMADAMALPLRCLFSGAGLFILAQVALLGSNREKALPFSNPNTPAAETGEPLKEEESDE